jgi:benzodiazapine receptor
MYNLNQAITNYTFRRFTMNWLPLINILTLVLMLISNGLATGLSLGGRTTGEISDAFPVLFTPAGYVFSIWGIIYIALIAFSIYQALPAQKDNLRLKKIGIWFTVSNLLNTAWIFLWQYGFFTITLFVMLALLASLIIIYLKLSPAQKASNSAENWLVNVPFSIYLGWISVATIANFSVTLYNLGWTGGGIPQTVWAAVVIAVGAALGVIMALREHQTAYPLVLVWAFLGIVAKQSAYQPVVTAAYAGVAVVLVAVILNTAVSLRRAATSKAAHVRS